MTDKEFRLQLLQKLYDEGYRYIVRDNDGCLYVYSELPIKKKGFWYRECMCTDLDAPQFFDEMFLDVKWEDEEPFSIAEELEIVDWSKVPVDTKVLVSSRGKTWVRRYFATYCGDDEKPFKCYSSGNTSWSNEDDLIEWEYCKLAEEVDK